MLDGAFVDSERFSELVVADDARFVGLVVGVIEHGVVAGVFELDLELFVGTFGTILVGGGCFFDVFVEPD